MKLILTSKQFSTLSNFCSDVAKGLMLAGLLGQGFVSVDSNFLKLIGSVIIISSSLLFLYFSLLLNRK